MADILDVFLSGFGPGRTVTAPTIPIPNFVISAPGDQDTGGFGGIIIDLIGDLIGGSLPVLPRLPPAPGGTPPLLPGRIPPGPIAPGSPGACLPNPCCSGKHLDKTTGTKCVSNRRMNPLNPKALRRAIRRAKGFERFVHSNRKSLRALAKI